LLVKQIKLIVLSKGNSSNLVRGYQLIQKKNETKSYQLDFMLRIRKLANLMLFIVGNSDLIVLNEHSNGVTSFEVYSYTYTGLKAKTASCSSLQVLLIWKIWYQRPVFSYQARL